MPSSSTRKAAVFLDRDGTVNEQMGYINHISRFHLLPGVAEAIKTLNDQDIPVVIVTNQSGLARGYFSVQLLDEVHTKMNSLLAIAGAHVDGIYVCPHHPEAKEDKYRKKCDCRKPGTGLLEQAAFDLNLDLERSYLVGDRWSDVKCAVRAGCTPVLVMTGYGRGDHDYIGPAQKDQPAFVADTLLDAVQWIAGKMLPSRV